ncbi:septation protein SepH [Clavibacter michiganensis]|uniref:DNA-binding protein n=3 Tax=Clavibacter michiganensis subsp. insidiosus TaxID=33014 RepID=A0A0D5CH86_9MICO|nr:septation protein SepH [Clavibacter michiganensis]AJW78981.1 DNA-binding protein [Clavibacter michiganensis subsp. insidiosus]AWF98335.1 DNA-binding protein [Clavibacter michiganensis subsp. insidiosus]
MQDLKIVGVEDGALVVEGAGGDRHRLVMDDAFRSALRRQSADGGATRKAAPRIIQSFIRQGMSAEDVARETGASVEYVRKFEGPVVAEREHVVRSAMKVPVHTAIEVDPMGQGTLFGQVIEERLESLGAQEVRWSSWKEQLGGWVVKVAFTSEEIEHDARWSYDAKKHALSPANNEAITLSQQGEIRGALIPRLRALPPEAADTHEEAGVTRFDSGAFRLPEPTASSTQDTAPQPWEAPRRDEGASVSHLGRQGNHPAGTQQPARVAQVELNETADLLEALRRRRGERESVPREDEGDDPVEDAPAPAPAARRDEPLSRSRGGQRSVPPLRSAVIPGIGRVDTGRDRPRDEAEDEGLRTPGTGEGRGSGKTSGRRGRTAMPSWDEIVFGARSDDDHLA